MFNVEYNASCKAFFSTELERTSSVHFEYMVAYDIYVYDERKLSKNNLWTTKMYVYNHVLSTAYNLYNTSCRAHGSLV